MGCFSFIKAEQSTKIANIQENASFKFLIPKEFGGGFIIDKYRGYGRLSDGTNEYDMYELLAIWNKEQLPFRGDELEGDIGSLKPIDRFTNNNRCLGIDIGCYSHQINRLKYPLKLVSARYKGTYEDCGGRSYTDPNQGWSPLYWDDVDVDKLSRTEQQTSIL